MKNRDTIRKVISGMLVLVFAFSITPKIILHSWVADHTDSSGIVQKGLHVETAGFHCNIDNLVAEAPFLFQNTESSFHVETLFNIHVERKYAFYFSLDKVYHSLRGPPVFIA